jgi:hypothetical protein
VKLRIVVLGYIVRGPLGGMTWWQLHYLMGLARLGHDVYFLEDSDEYPSCYNPQHDTVAADPAYGLRFAERELGRAGFGARWAFYDAHTDTWHGPAATRILPVCASADLLLDLCGVNPLRGWVLEIPCRVLIDGDPAFTQIRHMTEPATRARAAAHTAYFTLGENIGRPGCQIPDDGFPWRPTRQPVVLDAVRVAPPSRDGAFRTVMLWSSYAPRTFGDRRFGMKADSFAPYLDLPARLPARFELAVGSPDAPRELLCAHGWDIVDPRIPSCDVATYEAYIAASKAEFTVAKHGYVISHSGWFSERTAAFLATGRPALVQDTGFTEWLAADAGIVAFDCLDAAIAGAEDIERRYELHCRRARDMAEAYFDARPILSTLIDEAMVATPTVRKNLPGEGPRKTVA